MHKLYFWLPVIFGCHCRPERSFSYKGKQFPLCARCTGECIGMIAGIVSRLFFHISLPMLCFLMIPMIADGTVQMFTQYESTNQRRLITGLLFGFALGHLFISTTAAAFLFGKGLYP